MAATKNMVGAIDAMKTGGWLQSFDSFLQGDPNQAGLPYNDVLNLSTTMKAVRDGLSPSATEFEKAKITIADHRMVKMKRDIALVDRGLGRLSQAVDINDDQIWAKANQQDGILENLELEGTAQNLRLNELEENVQANEAATTDALQDLRGQMEQQGDLVNGHEHRLMSSGDLAASKISALTAQAAATDVVANAAVHMAVNLQQEMQSTQQEVQHIKNDIVKVPRLEKQIKLDRKAYAEQAAHIKQLEKDKEDQKNIINELTLTVNDLKQNQVQLYAMMAANVQMLGERVGKMEQQIMHGTILGPFPVASSSSAASYDTVLDFGLGNS